MNLIVKFYFELKRKLYQLRYPNALIGKRVIIKGSLKISGKVKVEIGDDCRLGKQVKIYGSGQLLVGQNVLLNGPDIGCFCKIVIGDNCLISDCFLIDNNYHNTEPHLRHQLPLHSASAPIDIEQNVWIGARATVMKGVSIGRDSVIGLGSIIRKSVPPNAVVIGNPQIIVKYFNSKSRLEREEVFLSVN